METILGSKVLVSYGWLVCRVVAMLTPEFSTPLARGVRARPKVVSTKPKNTPPNHRMHLSGVPHIGGSPKQDTPLSAPFHWLARGFTCDATTPFRVSCLKKEKTRNQHEVAKLCFKKRICIHIYIYIYKYSGHPTACCRSTTGSLHMFNTISPPKSELIELVNGPQSSQSDFGRCYLTYR